MRTFLLSLFALTALMAIAPSARAQPPGGPPGGPFAGPRQGAFSPYLNLTRQGASPAINYYGLVRPQQQFGAEINQLQRQVTSGPFSSLADPTAEQPSLTGHAFGFQNQYLYYQNQYTAGNYGLSRSTGGFGGSSGYGGTGGFGNRQLQGLGKPLGYVAPPRRQ
jgi:hypothetical protein